MLDFEKIIEAMAIAIHDFTYKESIYDRPACYLLRKEFREQAKAAIKALARFIPSNNELYNHWHDFLRDPDKVAEHCGFSEYQAELLSQIKEFGNEQ